MKLNIGSGTKKLKGYINVDYCLDAEVKWNLNEYPYPFKDNSTTEIIAENILEHLDDLTATMKELHRVGKNGCVVYIDVPYYKSNSAFTDPTHCRYFTWGTIDYYCNNNQVGDFQNMFKIVTKRLQWKSSRKPIIKQICKAMDWLVNINPYMLERYMPIFYSITEPEFIKYKLEVVK